MILGRLYIKGDRGIGLLGSLGHLVTPALFLSVTQMLHLLVAQSLGRSVSQMLIEKIG